MQRSKWISARRGEELAGGRRDFVEGKVLSGGAGVLAPLIEKAAIAEGEELGGVDAEFAAGQVDPVRWAFELGVDADGSFVEDAVAGCVGELGAPFLVDEGGLESELGEDVAEGFAVLDLGFGFIAVFMTGGGIVVLGQAFVSDDPAVAVLADTEDGLPRAEAAVGSVVEDVALESALGFLVETGGAEALRECLGIGDGELDFDFQGHKNSVQRTAFSVQESSELAG